MIRVRLARSSAGPTYDSLHPEVVNNSPLDSISPGYIKVLKASCYVCVKAFEVRSEIRQFDGHCLEARNRTRYWVNIDPRDVTAHFEGFDQRGAATQK